MRWISSLAVSEATKSLDQLQIEIKVFSSCNMGLGNTFDHGSQPFINCIEQ